ncbi:hypothetical protein BSKO_07323 [Bryopsis sp. KO-2023]|nr:hypothetical protein BSKO_07323 [Bryopsis sp. KO-2023]
MAHLLTSRVGSIFNKRLGRTISGRCSFFFRRSKHSSDCEGGELGQGDASDRSCEGRETMGRYRRGGGRGGGRGREFGGRKGKRGRPNDESQGQHTQPNLRWYFELLHDLIKRELDEEQAVINERLTRWPLHRLLREGVTLVEMHAKKRGKIFGDQIYLFYSERRDVGYHRFSVGDIVTICSHNPLQPEAEGVVYGRTRDTVSVVVSGLPRKQIWRLDKGTNKIAYERMKAALLNITGNLCGAPSWLQPLLIPTARWVANAESRQRIPPPEMIMMAARTSFQYSEMGSENQQALSLDSIVAEMQQRPPEHGLEMTLRNLRNDTTNPETEIRSLNDSQVEAVRRGLMGSMSLIQGPPGTGKTSTAVHLIQAWRRLNPEAGPVLATAQSNVAVDQLLMGCAQLGLKAVRIGQPVRVTADLRTNTLDAKVQQHPQMQEVDALKEQIENLRRDMPRLSGRDIGLANRDLRRLVGQSKTLMDEISAEVVQQSDVVCATCIGAGADLLANTQFRMVVVDEATQCAEPEAVVPLVKCQRYGQIVMIGDHQQLPPTVISQHPESQRLLGTSLFQRMVATKQALQEHRGEAGTGMSSALESVTSMTRNDALSAASFVDPLFDNINTTMLQIQYRMHPTIAEWPSLSFYSGKLQSGVSSGDRIPPPGVPWPMNLPANPGASFPVHNDLSNRDPVVFVSVMGGVEQTVGETQSKVNHTEVQAVLAIVVRLLSANSGVSFMGADPVTESGIGIISPYTGQVRAITDALKRANIPITFGDGDDVEFGYQPRRGVEIKSVDGYQGREKEVIILSTVRSNPSGEIGFLTDYRRLNVAVTRAKRGLVIVGDPTTLGKKNALWKSWLQFLGAKNLLIDARQLVMARQF